MTVDPRSASQVTPTAADRALFESAQAALLRDDLPAARDGLRSLLARHPGDWQLSMMLAGVWLGLQDMRAAAQCLVETAPRLPPLPEVLAQFARRLFDLGETKAAVACLDRAVPDAPRAAGGLAAMGMVWQAMGFPDRGLAMYQRAAALGFDAGEQQYYQGLQLQFLGRREDAHRAWRRALDLVPGLGRACLSWARSVRAEAGDDVAARIQRGLPLAEPGSVNEASFHFARFHDLDRRRSTTDAWTALQRGNDIMAGRLKHDAAGITTLVDATIAQCTARWIEPPEHAVAPGAQPIFVVGMPRSGTTLLERVLGNHSQVATPGELGDFWRQMRWVANRFGHTQPDLELLADLRNADFAQIGTRYLQQTEWRAHGRARFVDKLPSNAYIAGLVHKALPNAPILHLVREPMDVCWSNYKAMFGESYGYSYRLDHIAAQYRDYRRLMAHWHAVMPGVILDVSYRELVEAPEATARKVLAFCGLPWEDGCIAVERNTSPVMTLSTAQVREGIHTRALGEWRRYEAQLEPLRQALGDLAA